MGLMADLGGGPVGVDTAAFIYFIAEHPTSEPQADKAGSSVARMLEKN
jgi:hypothetical protein